jgi:hypothetical protein
MSGGKPWQVPASAAGFGEVRRSLSEGGYWHSPTSARCSRHARGISTHDQAFEAVKASRGKEARKTPVWVRRSLPALELPATFPAVSRRHQPFIATTTATPRQDGVASGDVVLQVHAACLPA